MPRILVLRLPEIGRGETVQNPSHRAGEALIPRRDLRLVLHTLVELRASPRDHVALDGTTLLEDGPVAGVTAVDDDRPSA